MNADGITISVRRIWEPPADVPVDTARGGGHGGGERMLNALYGPANPGEAAESGDAARQSADSATAPWPSAPRLSRPSAPADRFGSRT
jgi:hypothetical protein